MKTRIPILWLLLLAAALWPPPSVTAADLPSTGFTRQLLRAADAGEARGILGVGTNGVAFTNYTENTGWVNLTGITTNNGGSITVNGGTTNRGTGFYGNGVGLTNLGAANITAGGVLPALSVAAGTNASGAGILFSNSVIPLASPLSVGATNTGGYGIVWSNSVVPLSAPLSVGATNTGGYGIVWSNSILPLSSPLSVGATNTGGAAVLFEGDATTFDDVTNTATAIFMEMFESVIQTNVTQLQLVGASIGLALNNETNNYYNMPYLVNGSDISTNWADYFWMVPYNLDTNYAMVLKFGLGKPSADASDTVVAQVAYNPITGGTTVFSTSPATGTISTTNNLGGNNSLTWVTVDLSSWAGGLVPGQGARIRIAREGLNASETYGFASPVSHPILYWVPQ